MPDRATTPRIDLHAHPGRFFLDGSTGGDPAGAFDAISAADASDPSQITSTGMSAVSFATISDLSALRANPAGGLDGSGEFEPEQAYMDHLRQLEAAARAGTRAGMKPLRDGADLDAALASGDGRMLLACEGADFLEYSGAHLVDAHRSGVRSVQLVHYRPNAFGDVQTAPPVHGGLSDAGAEVVRQMDRLGMIVDLAHATLETTRDAVRVSDRPVMISHTHLTVPGREHPRCVSAEHARLVADTGGVIGVWPAGFALDTLDDYVDQILRLTEAVGVEHVGIGTDLDGNYHPVLTDYREFATLEDVLSSRGLTTDEVRAVLGGNARRLIGDVCR